ncbi:hypothetical protein [Phenylobacterium sp.]|uniref:hypothetical protein n=1 Tax=Phenylobacterium sp. TaxID=1871053 RepID=UPI0025D3BB43|nr:hypothetical protein [Phenylobacterium sp.]
MATLTEMVAAVVVQSSAAAFAHLGVTVDTPKVEQPRPAVSAADQRVVARSPRQAQRVEKVIRANCPEGQRAPLVRA